jgi:GNAT superfamily N-acetyltransferase
MATSVRTGNAGDMHQMFPLVVRQLEERAAVDPGYFALRPNAAERLRQWAGQTLEDPRHAMVVAEVDGELVGCLVVTVEQDLPIYVNDEYATVRVLWVDPRHRGKGVAGLMLKHAARECRHFGLRQLRASAAVGREIEKHVLKKAGFRAAGITFLCDLKPARKAVAEP